MKKYSLIILTLFAGILFSCSTESTNDVSKVTVFPEISIKGDAIVFSEIGQAFNDPGANASIGGAAIEFDTESGIDTNTPGFYTVTYSTENADGFLAAATRTVIIYENNGTVAGVYMGRRTNRGISSPILVSTRPDGDFNCTDILGGYYEQGTNQYGAAYGGDAVLMIDSEAGTITSPGATIGFGPVAFSGGTISADGRTMNWSITLTNYGTFGFPIELVKVTP